MQSELKVWSSQASHLIGECFDEAKPIIDREAKYLPHLAHFVSAQLFIDCQLSSESILMLVSMGKQWDADLINRSVMEGSLKLMYMLDGTHGEVEDKADQYWNVLPLFHQIRHGENVKKILCIVPDRDAPEWRPFHDLTVSDAEVEAIRSKYSKADRQALEERWSFVGLCRSLALSKEPESNMIAGLAHGYSMSSHLMHKDADGIGMVWDRSQRSDERRRAVTLGHSARIISDVCAFAKLRLFALYKACNILENQIRIIEEKYRILELALTTAIIEFHNVEYGAAETSD